MIDMKPQRGRPKGSGIDDSGRLAEISALICEKPDLKPTTAIRMLGVSDPSAIRRLRDKYNAAMPPAAAPRPEAAPARPRLLAIAPSCRRELPPAGAPTSAAPGAARAEDAADTEPDRGARPGAVAATGTARPESAAAARPFVAPAPDTGPKPASPAPSPAMSSGPPPAQAAGPGGAPRADQAPLVMMLGFGCAALHTLVGMQMQLIQSLAKLPNVEAVIRQQIALSEAITKAAFARPPRDEGKG